jgi:hypothetical protein
MHSILFWLTLPKMIRHCAAVTILLLLVSVAARIMMEATETPTARAAHQLLERSLRAISFSENESSQTLKFQHLVTAIAYLQAAREIMTDRELERSAGVDVPRIWRELQVARRTLQDALEK